MRLTGVRLASESMRRFLCVIIVASVAMHGVACQSIGIVQNGKWILWQSSSFLEEKTTAEEPQTNFCQWHVARGAFLIPLFAGFTRGLRCHAGTRLRDLSTSFLRQYDRQHRASHFLLSLVPGTRGGSKVLIKTRRSAGHSSTRIEDNTVKIDENKWRHKSPLSAPKPFFSVEALGGLTLAEIGKSFEYVVQSTRDGFNQEQFMTGVRREVKAMLDAMDTAASTSRGRNVHKIIIGHNRTGSIDAFEFCAAARILSEWRLVRQVPEGYKRFSASMKIGHKDIVQNIEKIEATAHAWIDSQREKQSAKAIIFSPTLRDLLQYEADMGYHPQLPQLKEASGAMGLLWVQRQLDFQTTIFENLLETPKKFPNAMEAFKDAYKQIYSNYHGAAVKKVFNYSLSKAPEISEVYHCMNPRRLMEIQESLFAQELSILVEEGVLKVEKITQEMEKDARENIYAFLYEARPLIDDVRTLIEEFNMNDPKKV